MDEPAQDNVPPHSWAPQDGRQAHVYPRPSQAVTGLVLSIFGLTASCFVVSPIGMIVSKNDLAAMDRGETDPKERSLAYAGYIIGIIGTVLLATGLLFFLFFILISVLGAA